VGERTCGPGMPCETNSACELAPLRRAGVVVEPVVEGRYARRGAVTRGQHIARWWARIAQGGERLSSGLCEVQVEVAGDQERPGLLLGGWTEGKSPRAKRARCG